MFKAVIFDFNGVLINDLKVHEKAYLKAAREVGLPLTKEIIRSYISTTALQKRKLYFGDISDETWNQIFQLKTEYYFDLVEEENLLFPEVGDVLSSLSRHYLLGLISNTPRRYFEKVFPQNLARLFQATIFGDEMRHPKPSPEALLEMMGRLKVDADQCCYVGDSVSDVRMAKKAGIRIFSVITGDSSRAELREAGSDWILDSLSELIRELNSMDNF
jgi:HAD superfamily hydrolase (TIGR01549 family)